MKDARTETWLVWDSDQVVSGIHAAQTCSGPCAIHSPTPHWMRQYTLAYDVEKSCFYRTCGHGDTHQDPDERTRWTNIMARSRPPRPGGKTPGRLYSVAQEKLEQWDCPECICGCCSLVRL
jgi:hypothetical protein